MEILKQNNAFNKIASTFLVFLTISVLKCRSQCVIGNETLREQQLLDSLKPLIGKIFEAKDVIEPTKFTYKVGICSNADSKYAGIGAIQYANDHNYSLGRYDNADLTGGTNWMLLTYNGGETYGKHCGKAPRRTLIMIVCDPDNVVGKFQILEERRKSEENETCYYLFELGSNVTCNTTPGKEPHHGLGGWGVFFVLLLTSAIVYLVVGILYKRIVLGKQGVEQIPNYAFWQEFGNLLADGCDFVCRCSSRQEANAYRGIDEHLRDEEERDDQLLNM